MKDWLNLLGWGNQSNSIGTPSTFENYGNWANEADMHAADPLGGFMVNKGILGMPKGVTPEPSFMSKMIGDKNAPGWGGLALGALQGIGGAFMGMKQYGLAKETLAQSKKQFDLNYNAQKTLANARTEGMHNARVSNNPDAYESTEEHMKKYRIV
jgi:hypothetical protein